jgi:NADP-dependent 3-hydroxy acid dehydrogenase YdfG
MVTRRHPSGTFLQVGEGVNGLKVDMSGKVCLVTGGTSGIGWVTARTLATMGARVVLVGRSNERGTSAVECIHNCFFNAIPSKIT